jgi:NAD(P)H-dependent flavin oxidoreductase YrpB (nitropropane dioxygenase family)
MKSFFIGKYEIKLPIVQGGMGVGVSLNGLAAAVANEGGVGVISAAGLGLLYPRHKGTYLEKCIYGLREEIRKSREKTRGVVGVNIMVALSNFADMVRTAIESKVDVIFAGAGLPLDLPSFLKPDSQTQLVPIVSSSRAARLICEKWSAGYGYLPDAIVVEGPKAGGHLGFKREQIEDENYSLEHLVPEVVEVAESYADRKAIPVIAAGGIATGGDIARIMALGAAAVQMGSIFVPTEECDAAWEFKKVYLDARAGDMRIIQSPVGMPGRAIDGEFIRSVAEGREKPCSCSFHCIKTCDYKNSPYCIIKALYNAARGNMKKGYAFAGGNAHLADKIRSVREVVDKLKADFLLTKAVNA